MSRKAKCCREWSTNSPTDTVVERKDCEIESVQADGYPTPPISNCCVNLANCAGYGSRRNLGSVDARRVARGLLPVVRTVRGGTQTHTKAKERRNEEKRKGQRAPELGRELRRGGGGEEGRKRTGDVF